MTFFQVFNSYFLSIISGNGFLIISLTEAWSLSTILVYIVKKYLGTAAFITFEAFENSA